MSLNLKIYLSLLFFGLLIISCDHKRTTNEDVLFIVEDFNAVKDSVLKIKLVNNSDRNYYITLDTTRTYNYSGFNEGLNSSIILKPFIYNQDEPVPLRGESFVNKTTAPRKDGCIESEVVKSNRFYKDYITLKNAILLKSNSSKILTIPFSLKFKTCFSSYHYDLKRQKNNEFILEYKMSQKTLESHVDPKTRDSLIKKGYYPYYDAIVSNEANIVFE
ncbi:hypothetical protein K6T82_12000 [Flavobacterium sp. 17A]|uniref:Lipoprotein n=1 Tax=Flavobacterium potami TaxID=2872310 RepID=A0A9X1HBM8_9FLAO|nr:hypothetical protein [Flavobacterium potami]MBZ4035494.1 hypothetical protein [Flavobacterium potami]